MAKRDTPPSAGETPLEDSLTQQLSRSGAPIKLPENNYNVTFHGKDGQNIGVLDFNGPEMKFTGNAEESAKVFFDLIARTFAARLQQEREAASRSEIPFTREDAAKIVERKAEALSADPENGYVEGDTNAFIWTNTEAEWQHILLEELAEEFRNAKKA